jgi:hypothetical protein
MANKNTKINNLKYWSYGSTIPIIDNGVEWPAGVTVPMPGVESACYITNNWFGSTYYWYEGNCSGVLQGDTGVPAPGVISRNLYYIKRYSECGAAAANATASMRTYAVII